MMTFSRWMTYIEGAVFYMVARPPRTVDTSQMNADQRTFRQQRLTWRRGSLEREKLRAASSSGVRAEQERE